MKTTICKNLTTKLIIWLMTEIIMTFLGLDNLADYSEYLFSKDIIINIGCNIDYPTCLLE